MSNRIRGFGGAAMLMAAGVAFVGSHDVLFLLALPAAVALWASMPVWRRHPERIAVALAVLVVGGGAIDAAVRVAGGIADERAEYRGTLDMQAVRASFHGNGFEDDPLPRIKRLGYAYMTSGEGTMTVPGADGVKLAWWSIQELAPWLLALAALGVALPLLRAARRDDPFVASTARRLTALGLLLLVGIPAIPVLRFLAALITSEGTSVEPTLEPSLMLTPLHLLPGVLVLALARIFRRGAELRDLERHTV